MTRGVIVIGAGGHAKVCIELLRDSRFHVAFCVGGPDSVAECLGVPVLIGDEHLARLRSEGFEEIFVAIGSNSLRERLGMQVAALGFRLVNAVSSRATVSPSARIGQGVAIMAGAVINADSRIGDLCIINTLASVDHDGDLATAVHVAPHVALAGNVSIGARTFLGVGCKVIPEIEIGADSFAAAGSVITQAVAAHSRIAGVPAQPMRKPH